MLKEMHFFCWYLQLSGNHEKQDGVCNEIQRTKAWPCIQDKAIERNEQKTRTRISGNPDCNAKACCGA